MWIVTENGGPAMGTGRQCMGRPGDNHVDVNTDMEYMRDVTGCVV